MNSDLVLIATKEFQNLKIGKEFNLGYRKFKVKKYNENGNGCKKCYFNQSYISCAALREENMLPKCFEQIRLDNNSVYFEEVK